MDASRPQPPLGDLEAPALAEQHVARGHPHRVEHQLGVATRAIVEAEHRHVAQHLNAGRMPRHQDHRLLAVAVGVVGIGLAHHDQQLAALVHRTRGVPLAAVDHVVVAVAADRGLDVGRIAGRHRRLGHRESRTDLAGQQRHQPIALLRRRAVLRQHLHVAGIGRRAVEDLGRPQHPAHDLLDRCVLQVAQA